MEMIVDYIKHAYICKFNGLTNTCYAQYRLILYGDFLMSKCRKRSRFGSPLSRRFGFPLLPYVILVIVVLLSAFKSTGNAHTSVWGRVELLVVWCLVCLLLKVIYNPNNP